MTAASDGDAEHTAVLGALWGVTGIPWACSQTRQAKIKVNCSWKFIKICCYLFLKNLLLEIS